MSSAARLAAPMMLVGATALSVEISSIWSTPLARHTSASWRVPSTLVATASGGLASARGTCFRAAAWKTSSGRSSAKTDSSRPRLRISPSTARRASSGWRAPISRSIS